MKPRRILIVCYFFPPLAGGGVHRMLSLAAHLPRFGWECTVVCAGEGDYWVRDPSLLERVPRGTEVIRVRGGSSAALGLRALAGASGRRSSGAFRWLRRLAAWLAVPDAYVGWARRATRVTRSRLAKGDISVLLTSSPPDSVHAVARAARRARIPWVADFRDPWIGLYFRHPPTSWHRARQVARERAVLETADLVTVASHTHLAELGRLSGGRARRAEYWPNGFEAAPPGIPDPPRPGGPRMSLVFTGTLSEMPAAETFMEAVAELCKRHSQARRRIRVVLAGSHESGYPDRAQGLGLVGVVEFPGPLDHAQARRLQAQADVLLLWKPAAAGYRTMVPGKLYEYLAARRPILAILPEDDEAAELVRRGGGVVVPPGARGPLLGALEQRYLAFDSGTPSLPPLPWLEDHERARLAQRMASWLDELVPPGRGDP